MNKAGRRGEREANTNPKTCNVEDTPAETSKTPGDIKATPRRTSEACSKDKNTQSITLKVFFDEDVIAPKPPAAPRFRKRRPLRKFQLSGKSVITPLKILRICSRCRAKISRASEAGGIAASRISTPPRNFSHTPLRIIDTPAFQPPKAPRICNSPGKIRVRRTCFVSFAEPTPEPDTPPGLVNDMPKTPFPYLEIDVSIITPYAHRKHPEVAYRRSFPVILPPDASLFAPLSDEDSEE